MFRNKLGFGLIAEGAIANWLLKQGWSILPAYEVPVDRDKGPRLITPWGEVVAPDMIVFRGSETRWVETKRKAHFSWHRLTQQWVMGIDLPYYLEYLVVADRIQVPLYIMFYLTDPVPRRDDQENGCPQICPTGLYGQTIQHLRQHESYRHPNFGPSGGVFWAERTMIKFAKKIEKDNISQMFKRV